MTTANPINFSAWIERGAVYGFKDHLHVFWGDAAQSNAPTGYPSIYSNDFFLNHSQPWTRYSHHAHVPPQILETSPPQNLQWEAPNYSQFVEHFELAQKGFRDGSLKKIVLATETRAPRTYAPHVFLKKALGEIPANTHLYGQWSEGAGFIGFTPEVLFQRKGKHVETMALAGTSALESASDVLSSAKNREEHQWVIDDIQDVLQTFGTVHVAPTTTLDLSTLSHLCTPITADLDSNLDVSALVRALHPTPALGASPRAQISRLNQWRKGYGFFGAPFGVAESADSFTALVGIRQLAWDEDYYYIRCGCGVVKGSDVEEEWQELLLKIRSVKERFGWMEE